MRSSFSTLRMYLTLKYCTKRINGVIKTILIQNTEKSYQTKSIFITRRKEYRVKYYSNISCSSIEQTILHALQIYYPTSNLTVMRFGPSVIQPMDFG